jgi:peroxiredoxin
MRSLLLLGSLTVACAGSGPPSAAAPAPPSDSSADASDFTLTDVDGKQVSLSDYLGKSAIIVDFWATWCKPCIAEMVHLQKLYDKKKAGGFVVLAVSIDGPETEAQVAPFVKNKGFTFPVLLDSETRVTSLYNPRRAAPYTVLIDRRGKVVAKREGFNPGDEVQLEKDVDAAMK